MFLKNLCYINIFKSVTTDSKTGNVKLALKMVSGLSERNPRLYLFLETELYGSIRTPTTGFGVYQQLSYPVPLATFSYRCAKPSVGIPCLMSYSVTPGPSESVSKWLARFERI